MPGIGMPPEAIAEAKFDEKTGWGTVRYILADGTNSKSYPASGLTAKDMAESRKDHLEMMLLRGEWPQIIWDDSRRSLGMSDLEMKERGYFWNAEKGYWEFGQEPAGTPQIYGAGQGGYGGYYNYPSRGFRGGGGRRGGGGGSYSYPSYLPRESGQFPQSFVGQEQRGRVPQVDRTRAARFGAVTWRI
jgi:hypothetical protein